MRLRTFGSPIPQELSIQAKGEVWELDHAHGRMILLLVGEMAS